jgi:hypothetical protein
MALLLYSETNLLCKKGEGTAKRTTFALYLYKTCSVSLSCYILICISKQFKKNCNIPIIFMENALGSFLYYAR